MARALDIFSSPSPSDGGKRLSACAAGLACSAFMLYAKGASEARWRAATRVDADAAKFALVFGDVDADVNGDVTRAA